MNGFQDRIEEFNMTKKSILLFFVLGMFLLPSCISLFPKKKTQEPVAQYQPGYMMRTAPAEKEGPLAGASLWKDVSYRDFFKDLRAYKVGDLVTVNIVETAKASKKAKTKTSRDSSIDAGITNALGWEKKIRHLTSLGNAKVRNDFNNATLFKANMKNSFDGSGETSRDESMTASITARVMDVLPNGNLFIKGTREVKVNNENQIITLTGLIRPEDVSPSNTVLSSFIADARITYAGSGSVSDKQKPGWLMRAVDFVWPF